DKELIRKKIDAEVGRLGGNLAEYKKISGLMLYFDELPKTSTRKIKRNAVKEIIASGVTA
ncbi:MAG: hypothetical protein PHC68_07560, partial [Syntrophorhabdaceae bacterium]|nr:hypothetical protein [Syntrophorhabdaceae bacterium]